MTSKKQGAGLEIGRLRAKEPEVSATDSVDLGEVEAEKVVIASGSPLPGNTFSSSDGDQNIAQGTNPIGSQVNTGCSQSGSGAVVQHGGAAAGEGGVAVGGDIHGDNYSSGGGDQYNPKDQATVIKDSTVHLHQNRPAPSPVPRLPPPENEQFLYREKELAWLLERLRPGKVVSVCGPGGMGKSALAAQAVHRLELDRFPDGIVFYTFYGQPATESALHYLIRAFEREPEPPLDLTVRRTLAAKKALLILDGAEDADDLKAVLDLRGSCGVLITSRRRRDAPDDRFDLFPLEESESAEVLRA